MRRVVLLTAAVAGHRPRKQMVETAHPRLREAWAATGTLTAADTPDTRGWVTLPARIHHIRLRLAEGVHTVKVRVGTRQYRKTVRIQNNQIKVINLSRHRAG